LIAFSTLAKASFVVSVAAIATVSCVLPVGDNGVYPVRGTLLPSTVIEMFLPVAGEVLSVIVTVLAVPLTSPVVISASAIASSIPETFKAPF
jgi:hypothetical protein